jgi:hypothetical protein
MIYSKQLRISFETTLRSRENFFIGGRVSLCKLLFFVTSKNISCIRNPNIRSFVAISLFSSHHSWYALNSSRALIVSPG